jgi:hypothetical protein
MKKSQIWWMAYLAAISGSALSDSDTVGEDSISKIATLVADRAVADFEKRFPEGLSANV